MSIETITTLKRELGVLAARAAALSAELDRTRDAMSAVQAAIEAISNLSLGNETETSAPFAVKGAEGESASFTAINKNLIKALMAQRIKKYDPEQPLTIKEKIISVLQESGDDGLDSSEVIEKIREKFGIDIERTSLSPQLSRLKQENILVQNGPKWMLLFK